MGRIKKSEKYWKHSTQYYRKYKLYKSSAVQLSQNVTNSHHQQCDEQPNEKTLVEPVSHMEKHLVQ